MKLNSIDAGIYNISMTEEELFHLFSALREIIQELDDWEYEARMGYTKDETRKLKKLVGDIYYSEDSGG